MENESDGCSPGHSEPNGPYPAAANDDFHRADASYWQRHGAIGLRHAFANKPVPFKTDIVIIGGGLAGLTTAIRILERAPDKQVTVLEAKYVGYGASGRNGGLMSPTPAPIWFASARDNAEHAWAVGHLNRKVNETGQWLLESLPESGVKTEPLCLEAMGRFTDAGLGVMADVLAHCGVSHSISRGQHAKVEVPTYTVHPYQLVQALAKHAAFLGAEIIENCAVDEIKSHIAPGGPTTVTVATGENIVADKAIVCTNAYTKRPDLVPSLRAKPVHNYMLATAPLTDEQFVSVINNNAFTVELNKAYVFYRLHDRRIIFGGIEKMSQKSSNDFDVPMDVLTQLKVHFAQTFPALKDIKTAEAWGGKFHQTLTDLPIIRHESKMPGVILNVGYGGTGVSLTLTCASIAAALALGNDYENSDDERLHHAINTTGLPVVGGMRFAVRVGMRLLAGNRRLPASS